jgi:hypothetical protein
MVVCQLTYWAALVTLHLLVLQGLPWILVDLLGAYKISPELKKRATELRAKVAQDALKQVKGAQCAVSCVLVTLDNLGDGYLPV